VFVFALDEKVYKQYYHVSHKLHIKIIFLSFT